MAKLAHLRVNRAQRFFISWIFQNFRDPTRDRFHFGLFHPARRKGRSSNAHATGDERRALFVRNGIFVNRDPSFIESDFGVFAGDLFFLQINDDQMIVGTAGHEIETFGKKTVGECSRVRDDLFTIRFKLGLKGFMK